MEVNTTLAVKGRRKYEVYVYAVQVD